MSCLYISCNLNCSLFKSVYLIILFNLPPLWGKWVLIHSSSTFSSGSSLCPILASLFFNSSHFCTRGIWSVNHWL
jgi:hypothetical protein